MKEKHKKSIDLCWATRDALHALMLNLYAVIFWSDCRQHIIEISHYSYVHHISTMTTFICCMCRSNAQKDP